MSLSNRNRDNNSGRKASSSLSSSSSSLSSLSYLPSKGRNTLRHVGSSSTSTSAANKFVAAGAVINGGIHGSSVFDQCPTTNVNHVHLDNKNNLSTSSSSSSSTQLDTSLGNSINMNSFRRPNSYQHRVPLANSIHDKERPHRRPHPRHQHMYNRRTEPAIDFTMYDEQTLHTDFERTHEDDQGYNRNRQNTHVHAHAHTHSSSHIYNPTIDGDNTQIQEYPWMQSSSSSSSSSFSSSSSSSVSPSTPSSPSMSESSTFYNGHTSPASTWNSHQDPLDQQQTIATTNAATTNANDRSFGGFDYDSSAAATTTTTSSSSSSSNQLQYGNDDYDDHKYSTVSSPTSGSSGLTNSGGGGAVWTTSRGIWRGNNNEDVSVDDKDELDRQQQYDHTDHSDMSSSTMESLSSSSMAETFSGITTSSTDTATNGNPFGGGTSSSSSFPSRTNGMSFSTNNQSGMDQHNSIAHDQTSVHQQPSSWTHSHTTPATTTTSFAPSTEKTNENSADNAHSMKSNGGDDLVSFLTSSSSSSSSPSSTTTFGVTNTDANDGDGDKSSFESASTVSPFSSSSSSFQHGTSFGSPPFSVGGDKSTSAEAEWNDSSPRWTDHTSPSSNNDLLDGPSSSASGAATSDVASNVATPSKSRSTFGNYDPNASSTSASASTDGINKIPSTMKPSWKPSSSSSSATTTSSGENNPSATAPRKMGGSYLDNL